MKNTLIALAAVLAVGAAQADTLKKIKDSGAVTMGVRESSGALSYTLGDGKYTGFHVEICQKVLADVQKSLGLAKLDIKYQPVTSQNRIPLVSNGTVDIECGSTTHNSERARQVAFSNTIFVIGTRLMTKKDSGIKDFPDLAGKNLVTTAGTTSERLIRKMNDEKKLGMNIISAKDHGEAFLTLETGRAVAFMMDDALLYGELAKARRPADWVITGTPQSFEAYGCMMRKDDPGFKKVVDAALAKAMTSGEAEAIYKKWFTQPIPPKGLNLNFPLSDAMQKLYKAPNDKAFE